MKLIINQDRKVIPIGTWGTKNENDYEILEFEFPEELENYNKRIVYYLGNERVWDTIVDNKAYLTNAITVKEKVKAYVWLTKENTEREADTDFRTKLFEMKFYDNDNADGIVPTEEQIDGFNTMLTQMSNAISSMEDLEEAVEQAEEERNRVVQDAISDIETATQGVENLNIDVSDKVDGDVTVTLTKKDASTKTVVLSDGTSLMFNWNGTSLGIKTEDDAEYTYVDLQGVQGPVGPQGEAFQIKKTYSSVAEMNADFNNMQLGDYVMIASTVEVEDNAKLYTRGQTQWIFISDFSGAQGIKGETGATPNIQIGTVTSGAEPNVTRSGTNENPVLNFTLVKGDKGDTGDTGATGPTGNGIVNIEKTGTSGLVDTYTIFTTNGSTYAITVTNGQDGEVTQEQLDELQEEVTELSQNMPWATTEQATEIDITDAAKYSKNHLKVFGNTEQASYTGKNIFNVNDSSFSWGTLIFAVINNIINISIGDGIGGLGQGVQGNYTNYNFDTSKDYYFSVYRKEGDLLFKEDSSIKWFKVVLYIKYDDNTTSYNTLDIVTGMNKNSFQVTFTEGKTPVAYAIGRYSPDKTLKNNQSAEYYVQLEEDEATDYEPYTGGQPSPSPDYPQDIHVVTGDNTIEVQGKNFWGFLQENFISNNNTTSRIIDVNTLQVTSNNNTYANTRYKVDLDDGIYTFKLGKVTHNNSNMTVKRMSLTKIVDGTRNVIQHIDEGNSYTYTLVNKEGTIYVLEFWASYETALINTAIFEKVQIEKGTAISYVPYYHVDYPINLGSLELCKIGNYQDYLYKENGNWYKYGAIGKVILDGTQNISLQSINDYNIANFLITFSENYYDLSKYQQMLVDKFSKQTTSVSITQAEGFLPTLNSNSHVLGVYLRIKSSTANTTNSMNVWLSIHNTTVYYVLDTPTITQITDTALINQLEAIYNHLALVKGTNHITITASDLEPNMQVTYMQDLPTKLNKIDELESRLALLE